MYIKKLPTPPSFKQQFTAYPILEISYEERWDKEKFYDGIVENTVENIPDIQLPMLVDTYYHTIYGDDKTIIIKWKEDGKLIE